MLKKYIKILLFIVVFIVCDNVTATSGALKKNSIKTCPNGITYGYHKDHWHVASSNGKNYYAKGSAISKDPCPREAEKVTKSPEVVKSSDTSIDKIIINDISIEEIKEEMYTEINQKDIKVTIITHDKNAKTEIYGNQKNLEVNEINEYKIVVTAENNNTKKYVLKIKRNQIQSDVYIKKFTIDGTEETFDNNKNLTLKILNNNYTLNYNYELSDKDAELKIYKNGTLIDSLDNVNIGDKYTLIIYDKDGNINEYYLNIVKVPTITKIFYYLSLTMIIIIPIAIILFKNKRRII